MEQCDGNLEDRVVQNEALSVFSMIWLQSRLLRGLPTLCVESRNTHRYNSLFFMKTQSEICKIGSRTKESTGPSLTFRASTELSSFNMSLQQEDVLIGLLHSKK